jgi:hypothetical protein
MCYVEVRGRENLDKTVGDNSYNHDNWNNRDYNQCQGVFLDCGGGG